MASRATPATEPKQPDHNTGSIEHPTAAPPKRKTATQQPQPNPPQEDLSPEEKDVSPEENDLSPEEEGIMLQALLQYEQQAEEESQPTEQ